MHGDAGAEAGAGLRRGLIAVAGRVGDAAGLRMLAGTIVALGGLGAHPGAGMRRGSIVAATEAALLPTFAYACTYRPPFVALLPAAPAGARSAGVRRAGRGALPALQRRRPRPAARRDPDPGGRGMTVSLNHRALERADRLAADADAERVAVTTLANGTRAIDCGAKVAGGLSAGRAFAEIAMAGLGSVSYAPLLLDGRWLPGLTVTTDHPARACLASQYAGWKLTHEGFFAMASGPGTRPRPRRGPLRRPRRRGLRRRRGAVPRDPRRAAVRGRGHRREPRGRRARCADAALRADGEPGRGPAGGGAGGGDGAAQAARARVRRPPRRQRVRQLPAAAGVGRRRLGDRAHERRRTLRGPGPPHRRRRRRRARGARPAGPRVGVARLREAVRHGARGRGLGLLRDRPDALQPGRDPAHEHPERAHVPGRRHQPRGPRAVVLG